MYDRKMEHHSPDSLKIFADFMVYDSPVELAFDFPLLYQIKLCVHY